METTFLLICHGSIVLADRVPGRLSETNLSAHGKDQALEIVRSLKDVHIDALYASPLEYVLETATPMANVLGLTIIPEHAFLEIDYGEWTGKDFMELESDLTWKQFHNFRNGCRIPGGELMIEVQERMVGKLMDLQKKHPEQVVAIFSHNDPIKSVLAFFLGISLDLLHRITIDTGSISVISLSPKGAFVKGVNLKLIPLSLS
jgi:probable phosphoglycerate mutase